MAGFLYYCWQCKHTWYCETEPFACVKCGFHDISQYQEPRRTDMNYARYTAAEVREDAATGQGCLGKAAPGEPVFVLRAQDALAADLVEKWAIQARAAGTTNDKVNEAFMIAEEMRRWPNHKNPD